MFPSPSLHCSQTCHKIPGIVHLRNGSQKLVLISRMDTQITRQSKIDSDTETAGYQNKLLGAVAQVVYTGGLDCLRCRLPSPC